MSRRRLPQPPSEEEAIKSSSEEELTKPSEKKPLKLPVRRQVPLKKKEVPEEVPKPVTKAVVPGEGVVPARKPVTRRELPKGKEPEVPKGKEPVTTKPVPPSGEPSKEYKQRIAEEMYREEKEVYESLEKPPPVSVRLDQDGINQYQRWLRDILKQILPAKDVPKFLTQKYMQEYWIPSIISPTLSLGTNYERLEYVGDVVVNREFPLYLLRIWPFLQQDELTQLKSHYMSNPRQAQYCENIGLDIFVQMAPGIPASRNVLADLLESFFGALYWVSEDIELGLGDRTCRQMMVHLLKDVHISPSRAVRDAKTFITQLFSKFDAGSVNAEEQEIKKPKKPKLHRTTEVALQEQVGARQFFARVRLNKDQRTFLGDELKLIASREKYYNRYLGIPIDEIIGEATRDQKRVAELDAYVRAKEYLNARGFDEDWIDRRKIEWDKEKLNPELVSEAQRLLSYYQKNGVRFVSYRLNLSYKKKIDTIAYVSMIGITAQGDEDVLAVVTTDREGSTSRNKAYETVLQKFIAEAKAQIEETVAK